MRKELVKTLKRTQKEVRRDFKKYFNNPALKEWQGADVELAFDNKNIFTEDNWNDRRIHLFRSFFCGWFHDGICNEVAFIGKLEILHLYLEDQNYVFIRNTGTNDLYYATWYKDRGRTDLILHNGQKITLYNFKKLLLEMLKQPNLEEF